MTRGRPRLATRLRSGPDRTLRDAVAFQARAYERAVWLVRAFYAASIALVVIQMSSWVPYRDVTRVDAKWPAFWLDHVDLQFGVALILTLHVLATLWAMMLPQWRSARAASAVMLLEYMAFVNGFGKVNHDIHAWLWVSVVLVFLPRGPWHERTRLADRHFFLTVLWCAQVIVLFFYTLTGLWKVYWALRGVVSSEMMSSFNLHGFSYIVADRLLTTDQQTLLGDFVVRNPLIGWVLYNGTIYLESTSLLIAFRPRLHRVWGLGLICFHIGTQLTMGFTFRHNVLLVALLFVCSPFAPERISVRDALLDLPGVHVVAKRLRTRPNRRQQPVYDTTC
jgi:hypothetical protein